MHPGETENDARGRFRPWFGRGFGPGPRFGFGPHAWFGPGGRSGFGPGRPEGGPFGGHGGPGGQHGPFGPHGPRGRWFGRGGQIERGGVRVALLALLAEGPMHGYQMIRELGARSGGAWQPSPGSVYPLLQLFEDEGLVRATRQEDGRRVYTITDAGRAVLAAYKGERLPWEEAAAHGEGNPRELLHLARSLIGAVRQVTHTGSPAQIARALDLLTETRRGLYRILSEEAPPTATSAGGAPESEAHEF